MQLALQISSRKEEFEKHESEVEKDVNFHLEVEETVLVGNNFDAEVVVGNQSETTRKINATFTAVLSHYTGVPSRKLKSTKLEFLLESQAGKKVYCWRGACFLKLSYKRCCSFVCFFVEVKTFEIAVYF